jgi:hypothetical protein
MEWCCTVFQGWFQQAGKRGLGVFVLTQGDPEPAFILQYRALDPDVSVRVRTRRSHPYRMCTFTSVPGMVLS